MQVAIILFITMICVEIFLLCAILPALRRRTRRKRKARKQTKIVQVTTNQQESVDLDENEDDNFEWDVTEFTDDYYKLSFNE